MPSAILTAALYLFATLLQWRRLRADQRSGSGLLLAVSVLAVAAHGYSAIGLIDTPQGLNLGVYKISSFIFWVVNITFLLSLLRRPLHNLLVILFPFSTVLVLVAALAPGTTDPSADLSAGMLAHIGISVLAFAVLTIAACQAAVVAAQDYQLRHHHTRGLVQILPPLQLMETILFEVIWTGLTLLTLAIGTGLLFLDDIFAQHLVHKTVLTIAAWVVFAVLLWGHHQLGWRSQTAARFTLAGFVVLMLGYIGSKLVLEVILQRG
jgi:ABC-type uncharacterized transport system permease subunit